MGSELSIEISDSWISYRNEDLEQCEDSSDEMEIDSDVWNGNEMEVIDQGAVGGSRSITRRGRGTSTRSRTKLNVDQFEWDF